MPGALHARQVLEALQLYGHFSTALKAITADGSLFGVHLPFSLWHCALQCFSCCFILLSCHGKGNFSLFAFDAKTWERSVFLLKRRICVELPKLLAMQYSYLVQFACQLVKSVYKYSTYWSFWTVLIMVMVLKLLKSAYSIVCIFPVKEKSSFWGCVELFFAQY